MKKDGEVTKYLQYENTIKGQEIHQKEQFGDKH